MSMVVSSFLVVVVVVVVDAKIVSSSSIVTLLCAGCDPIEKILLTHKCTRNEYVT